METREERKKQERGKNGRNMKRWEDTQRNGKKWEEPEVNGKNQEEKHYEKI